MKVPQEGSTVNKNDETVALEQHKNDACAFLCRTEPFPSWYILHIGINKWRSYQFMMKFPSIMLLKNFMQDYIL